MECLLLKNIDLENTSLEYLRVFLDDQGHIIVLPTLWLIHLATSQSTYCWKTTGYFSTSNHFSSRKPKSVKRIFKAREIADNTASNYINHFSHFLRFINSLNKKKQTPSVHNTELVSSRLLNHYLNEILPKRLKSSESLKAHQSAISAYYGFLSELEIKDFLNTTIYRKTSQYMAEKDDRPKKINYVTHEYRSSMLRICSSQRNRLILRLGFEVGLRSEENTGLILGDHKAKMKNQIGLLELFDDMNNYPAKNSFEFLLNGKYTKGGRSRLIYFDRDLLKAMKHYYEIERSKIIQKSGNSCNTLLVRADKEGMGLPISASQASTIFRELKKQLPFMNQRLSYHDLRHTFATELYHAELKDSDGNETRSESAALLVVSQRLGHANISSTTRYIRLHQQMKIMEEIL